MTEQFQATSRSLSFGLVHKPEQRIPWRREMATHDAQEGYRTVGSYMQIKPEALAGIEHPGASGFYASRNVWC